MKTINTDLRTKHEAAFNESIQAAINSEGQENSLSEAASEEDFHAARECYLEHLDLIDAADSAVKEISKMPEFSERIEIFGQNLNDEQFKIEGEKLVNDLVATGVFNTVMEIAKLVGVKAIGVGVAGSFQLLLLGAEKGYEGIFILPDNVYGTVNPGQFKTRSWGLVTAGVDFIASAGINFSFWFTEPESALLTGIFADLVYYNGLRFTYVQSSPVPDSMPSLPIKKPDGTFAGFTLRFSLGLEIGGGVYGGLQKMPADTELFPDLPDQTLMTLNLNNPETGAANIQIGETSSLDTILLPPANGENDPCPLIQDQTIMSIVMPDFVSNSVNSIVVSLEDWDQWDEETTDGVLHLTYKGANMPWDDNLVFTISKIVSNSNSVSGDSGQVRVNVSNDDTIWYTSTGLSLITLSYAATITEWTLTLGSDCELAPPPEGYPNNALPRSGSNVPAYLPNDTNGYTQVTQFIDSSKKKPTTWNVGVYFEQNVSGETSEPMMQTIIWEDGVPLGNAQNYPGNPQTQLNSQAQALVPVYYGNDTILTASALLV